MQSDNLSLRSRETEKDPASHINVFLGESPTKEGDLTKNKDGTGQERWPA